MTDCILILCEYNSSFTDNLYLNFKEIESTFISLVNEKLDKKTYSVTILEMEFSFNFSYFDGIAVIINYKLISPSLKFRTEIINEFILLIKVNENKDLFIKGNRYLAFEKKE